MFLHYSVVHSLSKEVLSTEFVQMLELGEMKLGKTHKCPALNKVSLVVEMV